jgi:hypothetical protein
MMYYTMFMVQEKRLARENPLPAFVLLFLVKGNMLDLS